MTTELQLINIIIIIIIIIYSYMFRHFSHQGVLHLCLAKLPKYMNLCNLHIYISYMYIYIRIYIYIYKCDVCCNKYRTP